MYISVNRLTVLLGVEYTFAFKFPSLVVTYLKMTNEDEDVHISFMPGKSRVVPQDWSSQQQYWQYVLTR